jgi:superfamily II DNA or RNA helicase
MAVVSLNAEQQKVVADAAAALARHDHRGVLLNMPTGSGKTLTALVLMQRALRDKGISSGGVLVVAPAATMRQWQDEAARVAGFASVEYMHGRGKEYTLRRVAARGPGLRVVLTTPTTLSELVQVARGAVKVGGRAVKTADRAQAVAALGPPPAFVGAIVDEAHNYHNGVLGTAGGGGRPRSRGGAAPLPLLQRTFASVYDALKTAVAPRGPRILLSATVTVGSPRDLLPLALLLFSGKSAEHLAGLLAVDWQRPLPDELHGIVFDQVVTMAANPLFSQDQIRVADFFHPMSDAERSVYARLAGVACDAAEAYEVAAIRASRSPSPESQARKMRAYQVMLGAIQKLRVFCVDGTTSGDDDSEDDAEAGDRAPAVRPQQRGPAADPSFSKIVALKAALASPDYRGERVLVLTAFKRAVNELKILLAPLGRPLFVYTGDLSANAREDVKRAFLASDRGILLATRGSMGVGVSLNSCQRAIMLDRDWTMAGERQARGRIFRPAAGQDRAKGWIVTYLSFEPLTVEEWLLDRQLTKLGNIAAGASAEVGEAVAEGDKKKTSFSDLCLYAPDKGTVPRHREGDSDAHLAASRRLLRKEAERGGG